MRFLKLFLFLTLALALVFSAVSCGDDEESSTSSQSQSQQSSSESSSQSESEKESESNSFIYDEEDESSSTDDESSSSESESESESEVDSEVKEKVLSILETKHKLTYNDDGSFRVLIIADAHMDATSDQTKVKAVKDRIKMLVDEVLPNLVIFTGDNTINSSTEAKLRANIDVLVSYIEEKEIPWCHVYGNHDHENALSWSQQQAIFESYEYCVSRDINEMSNTAGISVSGTGNYVLGVYKADGSLGSLVWCLDSGAYDNAKGGYDYIKRSQIEWYKETSLLIKEYNGGVSVPGLMAFHIPLIENVEAHNNRNDKTLVTEVQGSLNEAMCPSKTDTILFETILELGDVKAIVTGHDHKNDYLYNYKGVKLSSSPNISDLTYFDENYQGSRVFDLNADTMDDVPTYVTYIKKRLDSDDFNTVEANKVLFDFESTLQEPTVSGWSSDPMQGNATIQIATGKGVGGSDALEIKRDNVGNFEFVLETETGKIGTNKYLVMWCDFTQVNFRKACTGFASDGGVELPYRTDDNDGTSPKYYYLADGASEWQQLSHGWDGCFGQDDGGSVMGKKGYFAFPIADFRQGSNAPNENTLITGFYMYASLYWGETYLNKPFYIDNIMLVENYLTVELPTE